MGYYQEIAKYYDLLMDGGYYDHRLLALALQSAIGPRKKLLELGVGTGRLIQELLKIDSTYDLTGIDFSQAMVNIAKQRLPGYVPIIECDVATIHLNQRFDAAVSSGGTWVIIQSDDEFLLGTHLFEKENDIRGLQNVANHLDPGGLLVLSVHPPHQDRDLNLSNGIVYSQKISSLNGTSDHFSLEKDYCFKKDDKILAEETLTLGFYRSTIFLKMFADIGFKPLGIVNTDKFYVFEKII